VRERAVEALIAADFYVTRLVAELREVALELQLGCSAEAYPRLSGAVAGIRCLADILAEVGRATGVDTSPSADQELGRIALCLQRIGGAQARRDPAEIARLIEVDLVPTLTRLAPSFPHLEARLVAAG
jgi:hypothetical protein